MKACVVVPTIRLDSIRRFLEEWEEEFAGHTVIVVEDNPTRTFGIRQPNVLHYCWADIDAELGPSAWIVPRRTDCVRSFGLYKAYQLRPDFIVSIDDDCYPLERGFLRAHFDRLNSPASSGAWLSTGEGVVPRGVPYYQTARVGECVLNHGLWENVPDFDAVSQLAAARYPQAFIAKDQVVPRGMYFPMCGMNVAVKPTLIPAFYFLLMGQGYPVDRFGDIWAGIFVKRICDHLGLLVRSGPPLIHHARASNVWANLRKEVGGLEMNEQLWAAVDSVVLTATTVADCYIELAQKLPVTGEYWDTLKRAMRTWAGLFLEEPVAEAFADEGAVVSGAGRPREPA